MLQSKLKNLEIPEKAKSALRFLIADPGDKNQHTLLRKFWRGFIYCLLFLPFYFWAVNVNFLYLFGDLPGIKQLENPEVLSSSELYTSDGVIIGKYFKENRTPVNFEAISPNVINALIATEDRRFYNHSGIDLQAMISVVWYTIKGDNRGGSTITQQLVKNLYKTRRTESKGVFGNIPLLNILIFKTKEWITAVKLEKTFTKKEILTLYLNTVDFGSNAFGIKTAAQTFFGTTPDKLTVEQAAVLVGLLKAPTYYSPRFNPEQSLQRRNTVLKLMTEEGHIKPAEYAKLKSIPLVLDYSVQKQYDGAGTYFRGILNNYLNKWCKENGYDLYTDGLKVYTTIDSKMQEYAEESVAEQMAKLQKKFYKHWEGRKPWVDERGREIPGFIESIMERTDYYRYLQKKYKNNIDSINKEINRPRKMRVFSWEGDIDTTMSPMDSLEYYKYFLHTGFMAMNPHNGQIKAWVGGINYRYFQYDHVSQSKRQPGSTFKPFVYAAAIENGYSPCDRLVDKPITVVYEEDGEQKTWSPQNADWVFSYDTLTLRRAMAKSVNSITARLTELITPRKVVDYAKKMGINSKLEVVPSIGLGSSDVSVLELVGAYSAFVNKGIWTQPIFITRIEDRHGNIIREFIPLRKKALNEETAFLMLTMLKAGLEEPGGTSQALFQYDLFKKNELGGKTGTSSNHSDGWFVGVSKDLVGGAWVGGEHRSIHFRTGQLGEGAKTALPIFGRFMEKVYSDKSLDIKMGYFPKPGVKITKQYYCPTIIKPKYDTLDTLNSFELKKIEISTEPKEIEAPKILQ
ncbi:MAG TPA: transglycosylase domain-containing protein [Cytophagales bacterium]|nr:transglycosylase domain-containing protein [Cytophagales bacterium]